MKISREGNAKGKLFRDIEQGEVFEYCGEVYLATDELMSGCDITYNAIKLETADHEYIRYDEEVIPLPEAKLVY